MGAMRSPARFQVLAACLAAVSLALALPTTARQAPAAPLASGARAADALPAGWHAYYTLAPDGPEVPHEVHDHAVAAAFALDRGETLHPEAEMADLRARFSAEVEIPTSGRYRFGMALEGGRATLRVAEAGGAELAVCRAEEDGEHHTDWVDLGRGRVVVTVSFAREGYSRARLQTRWEMRFEPGRGGFPEEPIPTPSARVPEAARERVAQGLLARRGRVLLEQKGCVNCHTTDRRNAVGLLVAPRMDGVGERLSTTWTARWIHRPQDLRRGSDMPALLPPGETGRAEAADLAAFLAGTAALELGPEEQAGRELYHQLGCVACHGALASLAELHDDEFQSDAVPGGTVAPFGDLNGKWRTGALADYLVDPAADHPAGRMPSFGLERAEAEQLAAYLRAAWQGMAPDAAAVERGRQAWALRGCGTCHLLEGGRTELQTDRKLEQLLLDEPRGCLDPADERTPRYDLTAADREALAAGVRSVQQSPTWSAPLDVAARGIDRMACTACHAWNGAGGPQDDLKPYFQSRDELTDLGDEGRLPPELSGVGFKLTTSWAKRVLLEGAAARPYLGARMPRFGWAHMEDLAGWLGRREGVWPDTDLREPEATEERVLTGRRLMGRAAMACTACHSFRDYPPAGSPGPNLIAFAERLRYAWWRSYIHDPARYKPGTRMPAFSSGDRSQFPDFADGTLTAQADCMWAYFSLGEFMPPPEGVEPSTRMQIPVGDRPVVLRTFLENAGPRGIAVGFPVGVHFGFDAAGARLAEAWQGEFLDASGAWAGRGGQVAGGRGALLWTASDGPALVFGEQPAAWPTATGRDAGFRFRGYELDADGRPTFLYELDGVRFGEAPGSRLDGQPVLLRRFTATGWPADRTLWLNAGSGDSAVVGLRGVEPAPVERDDGTTWYRLRPVGNPDTRSFTLEVTP